MSNQETEYNHHSLNVDPAMMAIAEEVAAEVGIKIVFREPHWGPKGSKDYPANLVGIYCETEREAEQFSAAFAIRRWDDRQNSGGE